MNEQIVSQHNARNFVRSAVANNLKWEVFSEPIPSTNKLPSNQKFPAELYVLLKDTTDYGWYTTSFELDPEDLPKKSGAAPVLRIMSLGHTLSAFVNGQYIGTGHGTHDDKTFEFEQPANFKVGTNYVSILATTVGLPDSGAYMEHRYAGPKSISVLGLNTGTIDLSENGWGNRVGLKGEQLQIFSEEGSKKVEWSPSVGQARALSWFKTRFATPEGRGPVAIRMTGMGKGMIWVNGQSIGRHWMTFLSPLGHPTQAEYHIPRSYLNINGKDNLLVVLEEENACPDKIEILNVDRDTICSHIAENEPANVNSWVSRHGQFRSVVKGVAGPQASLKCPSGKKIVAVEFASFGDPSGYCGKFSLGNCNAGPTKSIVEKECLGKKECMVSVSGSNLNGNGVDGCPGIVKTLAIQAKCSY
ncbi:beta-galactosidase 13-like protein [Trifolium pratense]|uniref:beta-galactosidase n=1 Tax=Trifolium pratense TaxID=57577 RepID=A0A2K3M1M9_TRIPR|nr:beta-galactosidase 13-like protein [Trifolium pratense]